MGTEDINNITGTPVTGKNFFGRVKEVREGWKLIEKGFSIKLDAPRRVGKSSFAYKMLEKAKEKNWNCVFCNLQGCKDEKHFYERFITALEKNSHYKDTGSKWRLEEVELSPQVLGNRLGALKWKPQNKKESQNNSNQNDSIYSNLEKILDHTKDTLIVVDELIFYLDNLKGENNLNIKNAVLFLSWLNGQRQEPNSKIRWILCSSISIDNFIDEHHIDKVMKGLHSFSIDELNNEEATLLIEALAKSNGLTFSDEAKQCMLEKLGWNLPYYIQELFRAVNRLEQGDVTPEAIDKAYENLLNIAEKEEYFKTFIKDVKRYNDNKAAYSLLNEISKQRKGSSKNILKLLIVNKEKDEDRAINILNDLLKRLKNDGYIMFDEKGKRYLFRSPLLRDFWYNKFIK
ncbi:MAG: hypothetical protein LBO74_10750 [Candidatus Symbiothrix sp.]|jgi:hypothetical protein|nr:hypothetical protein [Candidatus Symbiothrix sp.]